MTETFVVIPVKDNLRYTMGVVDQLVAQREANRVIVLDNGSEDSTWDWLHRRGHPVVGVWAEGLNIHEMWNMGLNLAQAMAGGESWNVAILNNDLHIGPEFLSRLDHVLRSDESHGVVGACYDNREWGRGILALSVRHLCAARYDGSGGLPGFAFMLRGEEHYRFPEELQWWYGDNDMLLTVLKSGRKALIARHAVCQHLDGGSRTGKWNDPAMQVLLKADRERFMAKWGM